MLTVTESAQQQLEQAASEGLFDGGRLRVFIDHRCHCGKAHFSLALDGLTHPGDELFQIGNVPFVVDASTHGELPIVEIDYTETIWNKGFSIRNTEHNCRHGSMG